jgi:hypothetical protein
LADRDRNILRDEDRNIFGSLLGTPSAFKVFLSWEYLSLAKMFLT